MKRYIFILLASMILASCHESLEDRAVREAREYTEKFCPTPVQNGTITDSLVFDKETRTQTTYLRLVGEIDDADIIEQHKDEIRQGMVQSLRNNANIKVYKDAGFAFAFVCRSGNDPTKVILNLKFTSKDLD